MTHGLPLVGLGSLTAQGPIGREEFDPTRIGNADVVLIDESHNFRNNKSNRYLALDEAIQRSGGRGRDGARKKLILLSATPINNDLYDLASQISLFTQNEADYFRDAGIGDVNAYFRRARRLARAENSPPGQVLFNLLEAVMVRNTWPFIRAAYPAYDERLYAHRSLRPDNRDRVAPGLANVRAGPKRRGGATGDGHGREDEEDDVGPGRRQQGAVSGAENGAVRLASGTRDFAPTCTQSAAAGDAGGSKARRRKPATGGELCVDPRRDASLYIAAHTPRDEIRPAGFEPATLGSEDSRPAMKSPENQPSTMSKFYKVGGGFQGFGTGLVQAVSSGSRTVVP